ncbi:uncharacterized protein [Aegilops tauschii subsp. strangulata]|uniref:uncharacterized protein n=1 Tax=Aegilops tauschii subsp. strangulata TaxID=200361 RepID=UPI003CC88E6B
MVHSAEPNGVQNHVEEIIPEGPGVPQEVPLEPLDTIPWSIFLRSGMSFSATTTEKALQSSTSLKGSTKLSAMITGTHS